MGIQVPLLVGEEAFVVQLPSVEGEDHRFYDSLHPSLPLLWVASAIRDIEHPPDLGKDLVDDLGVDGAHHIFGLRNRGLYLQLLESLFAHFFANAQFPIAPQAWLLHYRPTDLRRLVSALRPWPWERVPAVPMLAHADETVSWLFGIEQMGALGDEDRRAEVGAVLRVLALLASDYTGEGMDEEYNSAKHGLRAMPAPWSLRLSPTNQPEVSATMGATHGSHFLVSKRGASPARHYFTVRKRSQSWHPERDLKLAQLCARLIHNLVNARRSPGPARRFFVFRNVDVDGLSTLVQQVQHFEWGMPLHLPNPVPSRAAAAAEAAELAEQFATFVVERAAEVARGRAAAGVGSAPGDGPGG